MATNAIPFDTATPSVPMPKQWKAELGKTACLQDKSFAQFVRELLLAGAKQSNPELAEKLTAARRQKAAAIAGVVLCVFCNVQSLKADDELTRPRAARPANSFARSLRNKDTAIEVF